MTIVEAPDRAHCCLHLLLGTQSRADLLKRQIRLFGNKFEQPLFVLLERRAGMARATLRLDAAGLGPALDPADSSRGADFEQTPRFPCALPLHHDRNYACPQVIRISPGHRATPPLPSEQPESDLHVRGNPLLPFRFTSSRKRSSAFNRQESRGAHFREDFPERLDITWMKHTLTWADAATASVKIDYRPVHTRTLTNDVRYFPPEDQVR